jgi:Family of unknown function (DUF5906)
VIGELCPQHYVVISQAAQLTGKFNAHFQRALMVFVDEGFWAGDKAGEGALKHLVTDEALLIEGKHRDAFMVRNLSRLIIASNEKWVVPAGIRARRWCVLDVANTHANDRAYFGAIDGSSDAASTAGSRAEACEWRSASRRGSELQRIAGNDQPVGSAQPFRGKRGRRVRKRHG